MHKIVPLLLVPTLALAGKSGTIGAAPLAEGTRLALTEDMAMDITMKMTGTPMGDQTVEFGNLDSTPRTVEVLENQGGKVQKVKVTFGDAKTHQKMSMMGLDETKPKPIANTTYLVSRDGTVTMEDGQPAPAENIAAVVKVAKGLFSEQEASPFHKCLPDGKLKSGFSLDMTKCKDGILPGGDAEVTSANLVLQSFKKHEGRNAAFFALDMKMTGATPAGPAMTMDITGDVILDQETGIPLLLTMVGPIQMSGEQEGMQIDASGAIDMRLSTSFLP